ncbi:MAG: 3D domain-containing protein [Psychrobacillus sp.]
MKKPYSLAILVVGVIVLTTGGFMGKNHIDNLEKQISIKDEQRVVLEEKVATLTNNLSTQENKNSELSKKLKDETTKNNSLNKKIGELEKENKELKKKVKTYQDKGESPSVSNQSVKRTLKMDATSFVATCSEGCTGITATGIDVRGSMYYQGKRVIAVDTSIIPLWSLVRVTTKDGSSFYAQALDTGGGINGHEIDLLTSATSEALKFGRQTVTVEVLREGK